jgi:hypothetical protein
MEHPHSRFIYNEIKNKINKRETMKPSIFISSTIYDFKDLRSALKYFFEGFGFIVQMSDHNDFAKPLDKNSYEACFDTIRNCDYFILLIGSRVGGLYDEEISITRKEYQIAYEQAQLKKLKIITLIRNNVWVIKEDRKALEKYLEYEYLKAKKIDKDSIHKIKHFHSIFVDDSQRIFEFIDEVCRKEEMKKAINGESPFPIQNWVHNFSNFKDIVDVINSEFNINTPLEELSIRFNLKNELISNINSLLTKEGKQINPINKWGTIIRKHLSKEFNTPSKVPVKIYQFFTFFAMMGRTSKYFMRTHFINKSIECSFFLKYKSDTGEFEETVFSKYLILLKQKMQEMDTAANMVSKRMDSILKRMELIRHKDKEIILDIENLDLLPVATLCYREEDVLQISKALIHSLDGDNKLLNNIRLTPRSPFKDLNDGLEKEAPSRSETTDWIYNND